MWEEFCVSETGKYDEIPIPGGCGPAGTDTRGFGGTPSGGASGYPKNRGPKSFQPKTMTPKKI